MYLFGINKWYSILVSNNSMYLAYLGIWRWYFSWYTTWYKLLGNINDSKLIFFGTVCWHCPMV